MSLAAVRGRAAVEGAPAAAPPLPTHQPICLYPYLALPQGPYLLLCTRRRHLGALCGHKVYGIDATALLPLLSPATHRALYGSTQASGAEVRYRKLLAGVQLTKDFFFS